MNVVETSELFHFRHVEEFVRKRTLLIDEQRDIVGLLGLGPKSGVTVFSIMKVWVCSFPEVGQFEELILGEDCMGM